MNKQFDNSEDAQIHQLLQILGANDGMERQKARNALVEKGPRIIDFLMELITHPKHIYRWEALKALEEIADPISIPLFIRALEDNKSDVRWIAAKGLIKLGVHSIKPLLKTLLEKSDSVFVLSGAHHVFYDLNENGILPEGFDVDRLLSTLKGPEGGENVRLLAFEMLNSFPKDKTHLTNGT